jgi:hypothetical protein
MDKRQFQAGVAVGLALGGTISTGLGHGCTGEVVESCQPPATHPLDFPDREPDVAVRGPTIAAVGSGSAIADMPPGRVSNAHLFYFDQFAARHPNMSEIRGPSLALLASEVSSGA